MAQLKMMTMFKRTGEAAASKIRLPELPERFRGGRIERVAQFWRGVFRDYAEAFAEVRDGSINRPVKAGAIVSALAGAVYLNKHNPDERSFKDAFAEYFQLLALVPRPIMSGASAQMEEDVRAAIDHGQLKRCVCLNPCH